MSDQAGTPRPRVAEPRDQADTVKMPEARLGETGPSPGTAIVPVPQRRTPKRRPWGRLSAALLVVLLAGGGAYYWWHLGLTKLPTSIVWSNGRIERDEIDIDTKYAGRVSELLVDEGDVVKTGQVVARMQSDDLQASLDRAEDQVTQAQHAVDEARSARDQQQTQVNLAKRQLERTAELIARGNATKELLDQRQQQFDAASAALGVASARVAEAEFAFKAAEHQAEIYRANIADNTLKAPKDGRIQYRVANLGEVLPAGGHVFSMLDLSSVYMDVFLPTVEAGKVTVGDEGRIVLDAYPDAPIPARVSFVATQAQFTPKTVETRSERDKLMFRVRLRVDRDAAHDRIDDIQSGLPGVGYVRLDSATAWPAQLRVQP